MDTFLGRALTDPSTGLPNIPYFLLIQSWEKRKARRRALPVSVIRLHVQSGSIEARRALTFGLCQELRSSDLIASDGKNDYRILLTSPDAENVETLVERIRHFADTLASAHHEGDTQFELTLMIETTDPKVPDDSGPCDPCDMEELK